MGAKNEPEHNRDHGLCFEKIEAGKEDAPFFQRVHDALLEARHESEMIGRLDEARTWFAKWGEPETQSLEWAPSRIVRSAVGPEGYGLR